MAKAKDEQQEEVKPRGCLARFMVLGLLLAAVGLGFALYYMTLPQDLTDIKGYRPDTRDILRRDFRRMFQTSLDRSYPVTVTECEINTWLAEVVRTRQGGPAAPYVSLDGVWVRLGDGVAEVVMERKVQGRPFTVSMFMQVVQSEDAEGIHTEVKLHGGGFHEFLPFPSRGGRFGKLVVPQGFLILVMPAYKKFAQICRDEIELGFEKMARIKIEKGKLTLDPRAPTRTVTSPP
jgi:hypothetical protein